MVKKFRYSPEPDTRKGVTMATVPHHDGTMYMGQERRSYYYIMEKVSSN